ncbi:PASTA domain-containing protein [Streptomyces yaanensis]|uniref:PASTA domain-containing protein n=1 Tax=Streptomyces yaanensis TaxID=1142239 RepID=A0ABV7SP52_9ACTN|nr:PASTA domain-containing protein [Streptomyces sp. CGMCC 4.7035]WNC00266.1 PASTA domain-containing protein [Streptomyces sp. CGMCC 4.7035]
MTFRAFMQRAGKSAARRIGVLLVAALILSGCSRSAHLFAVQAVAAGVPSLAPFFDEHSGLGHDATVQAQQAPGGLQAGNTPGLYGGSRKPTICDVKRLKEFLTDPRNDRKAKAWAQVQGIPQTEIPDYLDRLTPVLLRHDTLVQNHDYKKGRATPFNSLLQAGIAVLVDDQGQPMVKCSCGNPLRPFQGDTTRISVKFKDGNKKWAGYDRASVVAVKPAPRRLTRLALIDVDDPNHGMNRPVGTGGGHDKPFDTRVRHKVPEVTGMRFTEASRQLTSQGLAVAYAGKGAPPDEAVVTGSDPAPGTELAFGQYVTLSVDMGETDGSGSGTPGGKTGEAGGGTAGGTGSGTTGGTGTGTPGGPNGGTSAPPASGGTSPGQTSASPPTPSKSGSASSPPASGGSSSAPASGGTSASSGGASSPTRSSGPPAAGSTPPAASPSASSPPASRSAPGATGSPPTSKPASSSAPATSAPITSAPVTSASATSAPVTSAPATSEPPVTRDPVTGSPTAGPLFDDRA